MPVPASINDLSTTAGNNSPAGSESPTTTDDYLRALSAFIAQLLAGQSGNYVRANILGTVSQASGVPTGAVIERGSNANGSYIRYADGTQICTAPWLSISVNIATGSLFRGLATWNFPASFSVAPVVTSIGASPNHAGGCANNADTLLCSLRLLSTASETGQVVSGYAIGRWF